MLYMYMYTIIQLGLVYNLDTGTVTVMSIVSDAGKNFPVKNPILDIQNLIP